MAISLSGCQPRLSYNWSYQESLTGMGNLIAPAPNRNNGFSLGSAVANASVGGANLIYYALLTLSASANTTIQITTSGGLTDLLGNVVNFARAKFFSVELLSASQFAPDGVTAGTACSSITVGAAASNPAFAGSGKWLGGTTPTFDVENGSWVAFAANNGSGITVVASTSDNLKFLNNDGSNTAKFLVTVIGGNS